MALQSRYALIVATLGRLGEHVAFKNRVAIAVLLATQTALTVAQTELRAFGQSSSDTRETEESIPRGIPRVTLLDELPDRSSINRSLALKYQASGQRQEFRPRRLAFFSSYTAGRWMKRMRSI
jgi:hypothetical protein